MTAPATEQFREAIRAAGLTPPDAIHGDGKLRRFASNGNPRDDSSWYVFHDDAHPAGAFGDWRRDFAEKWQADIGREWTPAEKAEHRARVAAIERERKAEAARRHEEAKRKGRALWKAAQPAAADHPYLTRKRVAPVATLRELPAAEAAGILGYAPQTRGEVLTGRLLLAPVKVGAAIATVEMIDEAGRKSAVAGGTKSAGFWAAQPMPDGNGAGLTLLIGEGVATVLSAREATGHPALAALSCGNLAPVAHAMRRDYPAARLVILADLGNGEAAAEQAARELGAMLAKPDFGAERPDGASDFNDLAQHRGAEAVARAIALCDPPQVASARPSRNRAMRDAPERVKAGVEFLDAARQQKRQRGADAKPKTDSDGPNPYSETALADAFVAKHGAAMRFVPALGRWYRWCGTHWQTDDIRIVADEFTELARTKADELRRVAFDTGNSTASLQRAVLSKRYREGGEAIARTMPAFALHVDRLDTHGHLLNTPAGTIDLRDGSTRVPDPAELITACTRVAPDARGIGGTRFVHFLHEIALDDDALVDYLRRALGACLFASNTPGIAGDHWLLFFFGNGRNGKNTLLDVVSYALGTYAKAAPAELLMSDPRQARHPTDVASLHGTRMAICSETEEGARWNETRIKGLTGDATLTARRMREDFFEFSRTHRLVVHGNHRPLIANPDAALRARMHLVPFRASFAGREEPGLDAKLRDEAGRILEWLVGGAADYFEAGRLHRCTAVETETADYFEAQSAFDLWLAECTEADDYAKVKARDLYADFRRWKEARGEGVPSMTRWGEEMARRYRKTNDGGILYHSLRLKPPGKN